MNLVDDIFDFVKIDNIFLNEFKEFDEIDKSLINSSLESLKQIASIMEKSSPDCEDKTAAIKNLYLSFLHFGMSLSNKEKYKEKKMGLLFDK